MQNSKCRIQNAKCGKEISVFSFPFSVVVLSHPDFNRRYRNFTDSVLFGHLRRRKKPQTDRPRRSRRLSLPVGSFTLPRVCCRKDTKKWEISSAKWRIILLLRLKKHLMLPIISKIEGGQYVLATLFGVNLLYSQIRT